VASLSQGRTAAAQCGLFTHKSVPVIFEPPCSFKICTLHQIYYYCTEWWIWRVLHCTASSRDTDLLSFC